MPSLSPEFWWSLAACLAVMLALVGISVSAMRKPHPVLARWCLAFAGFMVLVMVEMAVCGFVLEGCSGLRWPYIGGALGLLTTLAVASWPQIARGADKVRRRICAGLSPSETGNQWRRRFEDVVGALGLEVLDLGRTPKMERSRIRRAVQLMDRFLPPEWGDEDPRTDAVDWLVSAINRNQPDLEPPMGALARSLGVEREYSSGGDFPGRPQPTAGLDSGEFGRLFRLLRERLDRVEFTDAVARARALRGEARARGSGVGRLSFGQVADAIQGERGDGAPVLARLREEEFDRLVDKMDRSFSRSQNQGF